MNTILSINFWLCGLSVADISIDHWKTHLYCSFRLLIQATRPAIVSIIISCLDVGLLEWCFPFLIFEHQYERSPFFPFAKQTLLLDTLLSFDVSAPDNTVLRAIWAVAEVMNPLHWQNISTIRDKYLCLAKTHVCHRRTAYFLQVACLLRPQKG